MTRSRAGLTGRFLGVALLLSGAAGCGGHGFHHGPPDPTAATLDLQGGAEAFMADPNVRLFYEVSVVALANGSEAVNLADYEKRSFEIFRALGASRGVAPEAMVDHLRGIPRQVVDIAREDPSILESFEAFKIALVGPP